MSARTPCNDQTCIPDGEVVVLVVDNGRDAAVWVDFKVFWSLMLTVLEVEEDGLIAQAKLFEDEAGFPASVQIMMSVCHVMTQLKYYKPSIGATLVRVEGELLAVRHVDEVRLFRGLKDAGEIAAAFPTNELALKYTLGSSDMS